MVFDLVAGAKQRVPLPSASTRPARVIVFDSGLGGLTVFPAVRQTMAGAALTYVADDAVFPYGGLSEAAVRVRVEAVVEALVSAHTPDLIVIACHTISTVVLPHLRDRWPSIAFVGTVPAIKPAAAASRSGLVSVLATPGTVARDYTHTLVDTYAAGCAVTFIRRSNAARSVTGTSNDTMTGIPMPTVSPCSGATDGYVCSSSDSARVVKVVSEVASSPSSPVPVALSTYDVPASR